MKLDFKNYSHYTFAIHMKLTHTRNQHGISLILECKKTEVFFFRILLHNIQNDSVLLFFNKHKFCDYKIAKL